MPAPALLLPASTEHEAVLRDSLLAIARSQLGTRYRLGAESPGKAFDCSGLVRIVLSALRLDLPHTAATQALAGQAMRRVVESTLGQWKLGHAALAWRAAGARFGRAGLFSDDAAASTKKRALASCPVLGRRVPAAYTARPFINLHNRHKTFYGKRLDRVP